MSLFWLDGNAIQFPSQDIVLPAEKPVGAECFVWHTCAMNHKLFDELGNPQPVWWEQCNKYNSPIRPVVFHPFSRQFIPTLVPLSRSHMILNCSLVRPPLSFSRGQDRLICPTIIEPPSLLVAFSTTPPIILCSFEHLMLFWANYQLKFELFCTKPERFAVWLGPGIMLSRL